MGLTIYWTRLAEDKLEDIYNYYKTKASLRVAKKLVNGIIGATIDLDKNPTIGQREELLAGRQQEFRYIIYKSYKIIYWVDQQRQRLIIANVFDCRQNPSKMDEIK